MPAVESINAATRWITRLVPIFLVAAVGFATYAVVAHLCVDQFLGKDRNPGAAIPILALYFVFFFLMVTSYARTLYRAFFDPGLVPLGPQALARLERENDQKRKRGNDGTSDIEARAYDAGPDPDPDSPGLEDFYTRDVFVCHADGRPRWCSECRNWKQDRVHHSSEIGRCVYRMDHYCPWVGGMIGENSFKFFVQFVTYAALFCGVVLGAAGHRLAYLNDPRDDGVAIAAVAVAGFFGLFSLAMSLTSMKYIFLNMTNVDDLARKSKSYNLAVRVARDTRSDEFGTVVYPLPTMPEAHSNKSEVTNDGEAAIKSRDDLATRTFAILTMERGANPWDLGIWKNWQAVMGKHPLDWILPIRDSPCANHESREGFYPMGHSFDRLRTRHNIPTGPPSDESIVVELRNLRN